LLYRLIFSLLWLTGISFASNALPFFGASYTLLATSELMALGFSVENFLLIVAVTAIGATLAKIILYSGALGLRKQLIKNKNMSLLGLWLQRRSFYLALFLTAIVPALPLDDYIYIGAGANKAKLAPMIGLTLVAKIGKSLAEIYVEFTGILGISEILKVSGLEFSLFLSALFIVLGVVLYKLDWESLLKKAGVIRSNKEVEDEKKNGEGMLPSSS
jgi:hypothetical protein